MNIRKFILGVVLTGLFALPATAGSKDCDSRSSCDRVVERVSSKDCYGCDRSDRYQRTRDVTRGLVYGTANAGRAVVVGAARGTARVIGGAAYVTGRVVRGAAHGAGRVVRPVAGGAARVVGGVAYVVRGVAAGANRVIGGAAMGIHRGLSSVRRPCVRGCGRTASYK